MRRTDIHTHAFHPKIAEKAITQLNTYYKIVPAGNGTLEHLRTLMQQNRIDRAVVHSAATTPEQVQPANNWAIHLQNNEPGFEAFGTIHPGYPHWEDELNRLQEAGIRGLKMHPDFQGVWMNDKAMFPIYEAACGRFILMFHVGDERNPKDNYSCPYKVAEIKKQFPALTVIAAHFGGYHHWEYVAEALTGVDVWVDTSSTLPHIGDDILKDLVKAIPRERWLFGSDYPLYDPVQSMEELKSRLKLTARELDEILTRADEILP